MGVCGSRKSDAWEGGSKKGGGSLEIAQKRKDFLFYLFSCKDSFLKMRAEKKRVKIFEGLLC